MPEKMYSFREAEMFGPRAKTWQNWYYARKIRVVKLGKRVYVPESEVTRLIESGTLPARKASC